MAIGIKDNFSEDDLVPILLDYQKTYEKNQPSGYAGLDQDGMLLISQIIDYVSKSYVDDIVAILQNNIEEKVDYENGKSLVLDTLIEKLNKDYTKAQIDNLFDFYKSDAHDYVDSTNETKVDKATGKSLILDTLIQKLTDLYTKTQLDTTFQKQLNAVLVGSNVGFGTNTPSVPVEVKGTIKARNGYDIALNPDMDGPRITAGSLVDPLAFFELGAWLSTNNFNTKNRDFKIYSTLLNNILFCNSTNGNVGIGTGAPTNKLEVVNTGAATTMIIGDKSNHKTSGLLGTSADTNGHFYISSVRMGGASWGDLILNPSGGRVGIGTTTPLARLHNTGGYAGAISIISTATTLSADTHQFVIITANVPITLPSASSNTGVVFEIKNSFSTSIPISSYQDSSNATVTTLGNFKSIKLVSNGTNWIDISDSATTEKIYYYCSTNLELNNALISISNSTSNFDFTIYLNGDLTTSQILPQKNITFIGNRLTIIRFSTVGNVVTFSGTYTPKISYFTFINCGLHLSSTNYMAGNQFGLKFVNAQLYIYTTLDIIINGVSTRINQAINAYSIEGGIDILDSTNNSTYHLFGIYNSAYGQSCSLIVNRWVSNGGLQKFCTEGGEGQLFLVTFKEITGTGNQILGKDIKSTIFNVTKTAGTLTLQNHVEFVGSNLPANRVNCVRATITGYLSDTSNPILFTYTLSVTFKEFYGVIGKIFSAGNNNKIMFINSHIKTAGTLIDINPNENNSLEFYGDNVILQTTPSALVNSSGVAYVVKKFGVNAIQTNATSIGTNVTINNNNIVAL